MFGMTPWKKENGGGKTMMEPFDNLRNEFRALYERFFGNRALMGEMPAWVGEFPWNLDVKETEKEYVVRAEVPGFAPEEIEVKLLGERLFIKAEYKAETKKEKEVEEEKYFRRYERVVTLPAATEPDKVEARYHNGVLEVHLPRTREALGKTIPVKTGTMPPA
jgi:HSP20 family protein